MNNKTSKTSGSDLEVTIDDYKVYLRVSSDALIAMTPIIALEVGTNLRKAALRVVKNEFKQRIKK